MRDFARQQRDPTRHLVGIAFVILFHALVIYGLVTGLARKAVEVIKKPLTATIVEEIKVPPPPPPPRKIELPRVVPPPAYVPPPDIPPPTAITEPVIAAVTPTPPAAPQAITPPVALAPPAPPPAPPKPAVVRNPTPLGNCAPSMPAEAIRKEIEGTVIARMFVDEKGNVTEVKLVKADPPRVFDRAVIAALSQCKFPASGDRWIGEQEIDFKLE